MDVAKPVAKWKTVRSDRSVEQHRRRSLAVGRARQRLARIYADEYAALLAEEQARIGVDDVRRVDGRRACTRCGLVLDADAGPLCEFCIEWAK
jgi:hypothetical protein